MLSQNIITAIVGLPIDNSAKNELLDLLDEISSPDSDLGYILPTANVKQDEYGAKGDGQEASDGAMTSGSAVLACEDSNPFTAEDVGKIICVYRAGAENDSANFGRKPLYSTIVSYQSPSQVTLADAAEDTVSDVLVSWATDDTLAIEAAIDAADAAGGGSVYFPPGVYGTKNSIRILDKANLELFGDGYDVSIIRQHGAPASVNVDGTSTAGTILMGNGSTHITVRDLQADRRYLTSTSNGFSCAGFTAGTTPGCSYIRVQRCKIRDSGEIYHYNFWAQNADWVDWLDNVIDGGPDDNALYGDEYANEGFEVFGSRHVRVIGNTVRNMTGTGIHLFTSTTVAEMSQWTCKDVIIANNLVEHCWRGIGGVPAFDEAIQDVLIDGNIVNDCDARGIVFVAANSIRRVTISNNIVNGVTGATTATLAQGITIFGSDNSTNRGITIEGNMVGGVRGFASGSDASILVVSTGGVKIIGNELSGMYVLPTAWLTTTAYEVGDTVTESSNVYLCLADHTSGTFATDLSSGLWQILNHQGIRINGGNKCIIANNTIKDHPKTSIQFQAAHDCLCEGNYVDNWVLTNAGIRSDGTNTDLHVINNMISKSYTGNASAVLISGCTGGSILGNKIAAGSNISASPSAFINFGTNSGVTCWGNQGDATVFTHSGAGTAYTVTATPAAVDMGDTDPSATLSTNGKYRMRAKFTLSFNTAVFDGDRTLTMKLRRTNNTAADVSGSSLAITTGTRTLEGLFEFTTPSVTYTTVNTGTVGTADVVVPYIDVSALPSSGSVTVVACELIWEPLPT